MLSGFCMNIGCANIVTFFAKRNKPTLSRNGNSLLHKLEIFIFIDSFSVWIEVIFYLGNYLLLQNTITRLSRMLQMHLKWMHFMLHQKLIFRNLPYQGISAGYKLFIKINVTRRKKSTLWTLFRNIFVHQRNK